LNSHPDVFMSTVKKPGAARGVDPFAGRRSGDEVADVVARALASIAPNGVEVGTELINAAHVSRLHEVELAAISQSVPVRRNEFATGRVLLRRLLGIDAPIPVAPDRRPVVPPAFVTSLAHDRAVAVAAVASSSRWAALGVDVEPATPLGADMARMILRHEELHLDAHLAFVLKEATYKAWAAGGGRLLDHHDVLVADEGSGEFTATVLPDGVEFIVRSASAGARHLALVAVDTTVGRSSR
jgi:4'-phosphopantetheinyl transferase EntD